MKFLTVFLFASLFHFDLGWLTDMDKAKAEASASHKTILLNFSGSDWCVPCIRMEKDIFHSKAFEDYSVNNLVLVNADFPRLKKHQLSKEQTKQNEELAERYNPEGHFPLTLLLDANGKVLKKWDGYPNESADQFISEINSTVHVSH